MNGFLGPVHLCATAILGLSLSLVVHGPAAAFCIRNDIGAPIQVEAKDGMASYSVEIDNNKKACCPPKDAACAISDEKVTLSITVEGGDGTCDVNVDPKGNVNVTGNPTRLKCKANKAGSTMDWASG